MLRFIHLSRKFFRQAFVNSHHFLVFLIKIFIKKKNIRLANEYEINASEYSMFRYKLLAYTSFNLCL